MLNEIFDENILIQRLTKLSSSQQSIESLSRWCISHRKKAKQVVEIWDRLFSSAPQEQRVSFLFLANDILQISRRKGSEFVSEFWKVIPSAVKVVYGSGNENCRKAASRLVDIWEERKVFGSRGKNLKNKMLENVTFPVNTENPILGNTVKISNPIKVVKRDANALRIKLAVGGLPEKILTAFQFVHEEVDDEETALNSCRDAISHVQEIEMEVSFSAQGNLQETDILDYLQKQETMLQECINKLENFAAIRVALVSHLKEALQDQESKLEQIQDELLVAQSQIVKAGNIKMELTSSNSALSACQVEEHTLSSGVGVNNLILPQHSNPSASLAKFVNPESKKTTAAALAAHLTSITSPAQMLSSVLSSFVAEEAAPMSSGLKKPKLEALVAFSGLSNPEVANLGYFPSIPLGMSNFKPAQSSGTPSASQLNPQAPLHSLPPPPPLAPPDSSGNQLIQSPMMGTSYNYGSGNYLPTSFPSSTSMGYKPEPPLQQSQAQSPQQQPTNGGHFGSLGTKFYGQGHQHSVPPIQKRLGSSRL